MIEHTSDYIAKEPCPRCGSRDNLARYSDGHGHCFGCGYHEGGDTTTTEQDRESTGFSDFSSEKSRKPKAVLAFQGEIQALPDRKIREETCQLWQYRVTRKGNHLAYHLDDKRQPFAAKVRYPDKKFKITGDAASVALYGQWLWSPGGKMLVITEGEIDALSVSQLQDNRWPVCSIPNGAQSAVKSIKKSFEYVSSFESVIFMFDMDEPGQAAAKACAELLEPGKAKIAYLPLKDANECLKAGRGKEVIDAIWRAKTFRPDGIISGDELWDDLMAEETAAHLEYPWFCLNQKTHGIHIPSLVTFTAGSGIGKSAVIREVANHIQKLDHRVGMLMLEESVRQTALALMGLHLNKRLHISRDDVTKDDLREAYVATVGSGRVYLYDHFGSTAVDNLVARVRYMARSLDCKYIFLDHLSIVVSAMLEDGDERKLIDRAMTMLRTLVQECNICLFLVSHLKRPSEGRGHEEGAHVSLSQLRGSHAIAQLSDIVIGLERNQQGDNPSETFIRVLKNRFSGETGPCGSLHYDTETGRLTEMEAVKEEEGDF